MKSLKLSSLKSGQYLLTRKPERVLRVASVLDDHLKCWNLESGRPITIRDPSKIVALLSDDDPLVLKQTTVTSTTIKSRGWTDGMIKKFLSEPCKSVTNPAYRSGPPMRLWSLARVMEAERTVAADSIAETLSKRSKRSQAALAVAEAKRHQLKEYVASMDLTVRRFSEADLVQLACNSYNAWSADCGDEKATPSSDREFLDRICVNYLRHECTHYDLGLGSVQGQVGVNEARELIRERVYEAIAAEYPYLAGECDDQLAKRQMQALDALLR